MPERVICNTSCLIALSSINSLELLDRLYEKIIIPEGVIDEFGKIDLAHAEVLPTDLPFARVLSHQLNLGKGEAQVIALAVASGDVVVLDDQKARQTAKELGLKVTGTIGILLKAEESGMIPSAVDKITDLKRNGFFISKQLLKDITKKR